MALSTEELGDFEAAAAAAVAELERDFPGTNPEDLSPEVEEATGDDGQASDEGDEQAEEPTESATQPQEAEQVEELFGDVEEVETETTPTEWNPFDYEFELPGEEEPVSFQELIDGRMRQRDYTQKTQEVAEQRKDNEQAIRLFETLTGENGIAAVRRLAVDAGLISEGDQPIAPADLSPFRTAEQVEAEIERRVGERLSQHPVVQQAQVADVKQRMENAFSAIESKYSVKLGPDSRRAILVRAQSSGTPDLELVFNALMAQKQARATDAEDLRAAAPGRSTGRSTKTAAEEPQSIEEAFALAEVSHGARG